MKLSLERLSARMRQGETIPLRDTAGVVLMLSIPSILEQIVVTAMEYIDAAMVGHIGAVGAHRKDMAKRFAWLCTGLGMGVMALSGVGLWIFAPTLMSLFTTDAAVIALGAQVLRIEAWAEPMFGASIVASGAMQGAGDSTSCFVLNIFSMWCIRLTLAFLLAPRLGLMGVWGAMCCELSIRGLLFLIRLARGKWLEKGALS